VTTMREIDEAVKTIPELDEILDQAVKSLKLDKAPPATIIKNFNQLVVDLESTAFNIYKKYETKAFEKLAELWVNDNKDWISKIIKSKGETGVKDIISKFIEPVRIMEFRAGQMRKARGGKTFEYAVKKLLNLARVPCEEPHKETKKSLKRIDLVSPNAETALKTPDKAVFIALKRTLRERWKQVVPEHMKGVRLYLVTINGKLPVEKAEEIKNAGIVVYVRDELKKKPNLKDRPWVRKLSDLPTDIKNAV
jgi:hypothetical protein